MRAWLRRLRSRKTWQLGKTSTRKWDKSDEEELAQAAVSALDKEFRLAAYCERYSSYRHLDTLRWQVPGLAFAVGGALLGFAPRPQSGVPRWPVLVLYGLFALLCARLMYRVGVNLRANNVVLRRYGLSFGDDSVPPPPQWQGASVYVELFLCLVGLGSIAVAVCDLAGWWPVHSP